MGLLRVLLLLLFVRLATAQVVNTKLDEDPVFTAVLSRRIIYPVHAEQVGMYAKVYAGFHIDQKGHIQHVSILNPVKIGYGFEEEVTKKLRLLPPLNPKYEGSYALPVTFAFIDYTNGANAVSPSGKLSSQYVAGRVLLNEIKIVGGRTPNQRTKVAPQSIGQVLTTDH